MGLVTDGRARRDPVRHPGLARTTTATWTSRSPARASASRPCRWTSRSRASSRELLERALGAGHAGPQVHPAEDARSRPAPEARHLRVRAAHGSAADPGRQDRLPDRARPARTSRRCRSSTRSRSRSSTTRATSRSSAPTRKLVQACAAGDPGHVRDAQDRRALHRHGEERARLRRVHRDPARASRACATSPSWPTATSTASRTWCNVGDTIEVVVINVDDRGKIKLSAKAAMAAQ